MYQDYIYSAELSIPSGLKFLNIIFWQKGPLKQKTKKDAML